MMFYSFRQVLEETSQYATDCVKCCSLHNRHQLVRFICTFFIFPNKLLIKQSYQRRQYYLHGNPYKTILPQKALWS